MQLNKIYNECCLKTMARIPDNFIDMVVTSPPYDNLREYKGYKFPFKDIAKDLYRVLKKGGVIVWIVGDATINGSETGTSFKQALYFKEVGFNLHDTMIYEKAGMSNPDKNRYYQIFEYMFILSKGNPKTFNPIIDRKNIWAGQKGFGSLTSRQKDGTLKTKSAKIINNIGVRFNIWKYSTGFGYTSKDKITFEHPATFPERLAIDHIKSWSGTGDLIFDPFGGSGTVAKISHLLKRNWILSEISKEYCEIAQKRIQPYLDQKRLF